jgi:hypothetical protein
VVVVARVDDSQCSVFGGFSSYRTVVAWGSHLGNPRLTAVHEKGRTMAAMLSLTSAAVGVGSTDRTVLKTCKTEAVTHVEDHWGVGLARVASQWRDNDGERLLGFRLHLCEIQALCDSIYRAFAPSVVRMRVSIL